MNRVFLCLASMFLFAPAFAAPFTLNAPTGTSGLIMVDKVGGQVRFFDPTTDKELASFAPAPEAGSKAHEIAISPDHETAYVTVYGDGVYGNNPHPGHTVAIVDLASRKMTGSIDIAPHQAPHGIQVDAKGLLYVACDLSRKVLILDPVKRTLVAAIDVEGTGHWLALLPHASKLYVANKNDKPFVSVVDVKSRKMIGRISIPNGTQGIVASPDGKTVLVADFSEPVLHVISTEKDAQIDSVRVTGVERGLYKVFFSPDGRRVLTALPSGQVNIFDAANLHAPQKVLKSAGTALMGFAFAADGKTALVGNHGEGTVTRFDLDSGTVLGTFAAGKGVETLAYF
jgi:DNA-binding beta-propeller fold protein YncE